MSSERLKKWLKHERSRYASWRIGITSGCDEYPGCRLQMSMPGHWLTVRLPRILRPFTRWVDLTDAEWAKPRADGRKGYTEVFEREYSISYGEGYVHAHYGPQTHDSLTSKSWCAELPWMAWRFVRHSLYDLAGLHLCDMPEGSFLGTYDARKAAEDAQPKAHFLFRDFDGEEIKVSCRVEEREWRRGRGWFRWLSLFWPAMVRRSLDLDFSSEVGRKKGSWKGGTVGHNIDMQPGESVEAAFIRYCAKQGLTFLGPCNAWVRPVREPEPADCANACQARTP